jgi:hypothetical protein
MTPGSDQETGSGRSSDRADSGHPFWIETVPEAEAERELGELYRRIGFPVTHILRASSVNPPVLRAHYELYRAIMYGPSPLTRVQRETIAFVVSLLNRQRGLKKP